MGKFKAKFYEKVLFPLYQIKNGPTYGYKSIKLLRHLNDTQWLSQDEILLYQENKLRRLINHVYENVPYYGNLMQKIGIHPDNIRTVEDLKYFPVLSKKEIKDNFFRIISKDINNRKFTKASTGGTTGEPLSFYHDIKSRLWAEACLLRGMYWAKYQIGNTIVDFRSTNWPSLLGKIRTKMIQNYCFPAFAKEHELVSYIEKIKLLQPYALKGYASNLYRIVTVCQNQCKDEVQIPVIFSTAEMLYEYQREFIEKQLNSRVYDYYGCNEIGSIAYECEYNTKHISDEHVILETTDSMGNQINNTLGEITITDLDNYVMPFIRYKNGDVGIINNERCKCRRGLSLLKKVEGRTQDFLKTLDGNYVPSIFFPCRFRNLKGIKQYQIIQTDIHNITLKIVKDQFFCAGELEEMKKTIRTVLGDKININVEQCEHIPLTGRGKTRLVISHLPTEL